MSCPDLTEQFKEEMVVVTNAVQSMIMQFVVDEM
jgi:hypothetical protein